MTVFNHRSGRHLEIDGAQIYVETQGRDTDPPLVLLHGGLGTLADFNPILPKLAQPRRLIGIDARGQGKSTLGRVPMSYERLRLDVEAVAAHLALDRYDLIAFSDGGIVALRMAMARRANIGKLVAIGTPWELPPDDPTRPILAGVTAESWGRKFPETVATYRRLNPEPDFEALVTALQPMWLDDSDEGYPNEHVQDIRCELLVVRGDDDPLVSRENSFHLAELVRHARLLNIPFAGHEVHKDQTDVLMHSVNQFLASV